MSFCGTIALNKKMKVRGFGMRCDTLVHMLVELKHGQGVDKTEAGDQFRLFELTTEQRAEFAKFAKNLRLLTEEHKVHDAAYWQLYRDTDYNEYEFFKMLDGREEEAKPCIAALEKAAGGAKLDEAEHKAACAFLRSLASRGHYHADDLDGGCF